MRTSLNEIKLIEEHLLEQLNGEDEILFQAKLIISPALLKNTQAQQYSYRLIKAYGRQHLKAELETIHQKLFTSPEHKSFSQKMLALFGIR